MGDNNNQQNAPLSATEYSIVGAGLFEKLLEYEGDVEGFDYQSLDGDGRIGFMTVPGGMYLSHDVCGGYEAQLPFQLAYMTKAKTNKEYLEAEETLTGASAFLETKPYPELDGGRTITKIICDGIPYRAEADNSGSVMFVQTGRAYYEK